MPKLKKLSASFNSVTSSSACDVETGVSNALRETGLHGPRRLATGEALEAAYVPHPIASSAREGRIGVAAGLLEPQAVRRLPRIKAADRAPLRAS